MKLLSVDNRLRWIAPFFVLAAVSGCPSDEVAATDGTAGINLGDSGDDESVAGTLSSDPSAEDPSSDDDGEVGSASEEPPATEQRVVTQEDVAEPAAPMSAESGDSPAASVAEPTPVCVTSEFQSATYSEPVQAAGCLAMLISDDGPYSCKDSSDGKAVICVWGVDGVGLVLERVYGADGQIAYLEVYLVEPDGVRSIGESWQASNGHYLSELRGDDENIYTDCAVSGFTMNLCFWFDQ